MVYSFTFVYGDEEGKQVLLQCFFFNEQLFQEKQMFAQIIAYYFNSKGYYSMMQIDG